MKQLKRTVIFLSLILFMSPSIFGQIIQPKRYEIEIEDLDEEFFVVSAEENGIYLFKELFDGVKWKERKFEIIHLDTELNEISKQSIIIDSDFYLRGYAYQGGQFVILFQEGRDIAKDLKFFLFNSKDESYQVYTYENIVPIRLTEFELKSDAVIFGGDVDYRAVLIMYNFKTQKGIVLPGFYSDRSKLLQIVTETKEDFVKIVTQDRLFDKSYGISIRSYNTNGEYLGVQTFNGKDGTSLIDGRIVSFNQYENLLAGTYSNKRSRESSRGVYTSSIYAEEDNQLSYYNYANLENFFNYMRERKRNRIKERIKRKKIKGKKLKFRYRLHVNNIIRENNQNILIGEAYYPTYRTQTTDLIGLTSAAYGSRVQVFDGYKYTHAIIIAFDDKGNLLWDNSFEINDLKSFSLEQQVYTVFSKGQVVMLYLFDQELRVKVIKEQSIVEPKFKETLSLKYSDDEIRDYNKELENLSQWYENNFFAYGTSKVKNMKNKGVELNRKVFFINKIVVE